ncbi:hypothetical protein Anas_12618 [Armadillidium nasatum]|uniref:Uncharacterized protein n=1 Tax=Armadillidium nasatum TaxID=96803 RepID=A0A5N5SIJ3_9CRUS|nr:hypothetical protein Anas_12618 [Armadillidium nasatum]
MMNVFPLNVGKNCATNLSCFNLQNLYKKGQIYLNLHIVSFRFQNINFQERFSFVKLLKMKTIILFGFLLSMVVLITEAVLPTDLTTIVCKKDEGLLGGLLGLITGLLDTVSGVLSGVNLKGVDIEKIATDLCKKNPKTTVCGVLQGVLDLAENVLLGDINPDALAHCQKRN